MRPASQEDIALYTSIGQALVNIQVLEECLSASITLKVDVGHPRNKTKMEADKLLEKRLSFTLGKAINEARKHNVYVVELQKSLDDFLMQRNWLIHKSLESIYAPSGRNILLQRIHAIAREAHRIQREIEEDLIAFSEAHGIDMSFVRATIKEWYRE